MCVYMLYAKGSSHSRGTNTLSSSSLYGLLGVQRGSKLVQHDTVLQSSLNEVGTLRLKMGLFRHSDIILRSPKSRTTVDMSYGQDLSLPLRFCSLDTTVYSIRSRVNSLFVGFMKLRVCVRRVFKLPSFLEKRNWDKTQTSFISPSSFDLLSNQLN